MNTETETYEELCKITEICKLGEDVFGVRNLVDLPKRSDQFYIVLTKTKFCLKIHIYKLSKKSSSRKWSVF